LNVMLGKNWRLLNVKGLTETMGVLMFIWRILILLLIVIILYAIFI